MTQLDLRYHQETAHVGFLLQLHHLTALCLDCDNDEAGLIPPDALLSSLVRCTRLTDLTLTCGFNSARWSALFAKLTALKKLRIGRSPLDTLQCFATGPITQSLEELIIESFDRPPSELPYLYALRRLRSLRLDWCFSPRLSDATIAGLSPPTALLPALTGLFYRGLDVRDGGPVQRKGLSFEWTHARLTD